MVPYILTKRDEYICDIIDALVVSLATIIYCAWMLGFSPTPDLNSREAWLCIISPVISIVLNIISWYRFFKHVRNEENYNTLVVDSIGIVCEDKKNRYTLPWKKIKRITLSHDTKIGMKLHIILIDENYVTMPLRQYSNWMKIRRLIKSIRFFSQRNDIIEIKKSVWFADGTLPLLPIK